MFIGHHTVFDTCIHSVVFKCHLSLRKSPKLESLSQLTQKHWLALGPVIKGNNKKSPNTVYVRDVVTIILWSQKAMSPVLKNSSQQAIWCLFWVLGLPDPWGSRVGGSTAHESGGHTWKPLSTLRNCPDWVQCLCCRCLPTHSIFKHHGFFQHF